VLAWLSESTSQNVGRRLSAWVVALGFASLPGLGFAQNVVDHNVRVSVDVDNASISVVDRLKFPSAAAQWSFLLNAGLDVSVTSGDAVLTPDGEGDEELRPWKLSLSGSSDVVLNITGVPVLNRADPTRGHISNAGIYLPPNAGWLPMFPGSRVTFALSAKLPEGWRSISQGDEIPDANKTAWRELRPQQGVWLVAGPFNKFEARGTTPRLVAWLRNSDGELANRYLKAARGWIDVYGEMLGTYPYNWFGNSVYVRGGNWSEGLVAYLADHLIREDAGSGASFRRDALQKYRSFVDSGAGFPIVEFRSRHDATTAVIGYDKTMMVFHMLRQKMGDEKFSAALRQIFQTRRYLPTDWDNLEIIFSEVYGESLEAFFTQWITREHVPEIQVSDVSVVDESCVAGELKQVQADEPFDVTVPVYVSFTGRAAAKRFTVETKTASKTFRLCGDGEPLRVDVDPAFDVLRRLGPREVPASVGEVLGTRAPLAVIPADVNETRQAVWRELATRLGASTVLDQDLEELPKTQASWIFGKSNRFAPDVVGINAVDESFALGEATLSLNTHGVFVSRRHEDTVVALLSVPDAGDPAALLSLLRYYDPYSFVAFSSGDRRASVRGQWPVITSPLAVGLAKNPVLPALTLEPRQSLVPR